LDGDVGHEAVAGDAVPVILACFEVHAVAAADLFACGASIGGTWLATR
jgi:hypothetical protein